jgi:hypothetical protein
MGYDEQERLEMKQWDAENPMNQITALYSNKPPKPGDPKPNDPEEEIPK